MSADYRCKAGGGFFAAGQEFERALEALGDGACKVYAWVCLHADRASGRVAFERAGLARRLGKSRSSLGRHLRELVRAGVCELANAPNQHAGSVLVVRAAYWPYEASGPVVGDGPGAGVQDYVRAVREAFLAPVCVQAGFGPADERLARTWQTHGVPLSTVRRAILLGSVRKSLSLLGRDGGQAIRALRYFEPLLLEVQREQFPESYWQHLEHNLRRCEQNLRSPVGTGPNRRDGQSHGGG